MESKQSPQPNDVESFVGSLFADRYRVTHVVSEGATTLVAHATDEQTGRPATLKVVRARLSALPSVRSRFDATMKGVAALSHPNIAAVYDWGFAPIGSTSVAYVVVEQLTGGSLRDLFDRGRRLTPSQALTVGLDACRALDYAHRRGFVHGELTPGKILFGDDRRMRIIDFGLSELLSAEAWNHLDSLPTHIAWYAAPEQGPGQTIDGKADVYALSLILNEAVTGTLPFKSDSTVATLAARQNKLMPVSADLGALAAVLERSGRPEPEERSTAAEFGAGLVRAASKLPRPEPLPILASGLFDGSSGEARSHSDPTSQAPRPQTVEPEILVVAADELAGPEGGTLDEGLVESAAPDALVIAADELAGPELAVADDSTVAPVETEPAEPIEPVVVASPPESVAAAGSDTGSPAPESPVPESPVPAVGDTSTVDGAVAAAEGAAVAAALNDVVATDGAASDPVIVETSAVADDDVVELPFDTEHTIEVSIDDIAAAGPAASSPSPASPTDDGSTAAPAAKPAAADKSADQTVTASPEVVTAGQTANDPPATAKPADTAARPKVAAGEQAAATEPVQAAASVSDAAEKAGDGADAAVVAAAMAAGDKVVGARSTKERSARKAARAAKQATATTKTDERSARKAARAAKQAASSDPAAAQAATPTVNEGTTPSKAPASQQPAAGTKQPGATQPRSTQPRSTQSGPPAKSAGGAVAASTGSAGRRAEPASRGAAAKASAKPQPTPVPAPPVIVEADPDLNIEPPLDGDLVIVPVADSVSALAPVDPDATTEIAVPDEPRRRRGRVAKVIAALLIILALVGLGGLAYRLFRTPTHTVPNLVGEPQEQAEARVEPFAWDVVVKNERSDAVPTAGSIVRTSPAAGVNLPEGEMFTLVVSDGPVLRDLPEFTGMPSADAQTMIRDLDLVPDVTTAYDETVPSEHVVSWEVEGHPELVAGKQVEPNNTINLVVSDGPAPRKVPDLVNKTSDEAAKALGDLALVPMESAREFSNDVPAGVVISQLPEPGTTVDRDSTVTFVVSKGPDIIVFPELAEGTSYADAFKTLTDAGFKVQLVLGDAQGTVLKYETGGAEVTAGQEFLRGTQIDITAA